MEGDPVIEWLETVDAKLPALYQESVADVIDRAIITLKKIISAMRANVLQVKRSITTEAKRIGLSAKLKSVRKVLEKEKEVGKKTVKVVNYKAFIEYYENCGKSLAKKVQDLSKPNAYKTRESYKQDVEELEATLQKFDDKLTWFEKNPIEVPIIELLNFIESEIQGDSKVCRAYIDITDKLENAQIRYAQFLRNSRMYTNDYLQTHYTNIFKRILNSISAFLSKHLHKYVGLVVFKYH